MPPARRVACAIASISPNTASCSIVTLPSSSAVVPRRNATLSGTGLKNSHSSPARLTTSTKSGGVRGLCRAPCCRGSTNVWRPVFGQQPGPAGRHVAHELRQHALRKRVGLDLVLGGEAHQARRIDQRAGDRALEQALVREVAGAQRRAVADADDADRRQPLRLAFGEEAPLDRGEQRFGHRVPAARAADQDRIAVLDQSRRFVCRDLFHRPSHRPVNRGSRLAKNAATPSCRSLLSKIRCCAMVDIDSAGVEREVLRRVDELLGEPVRERAARGDRRRQLARAVERRAVGDHAVHQPPRQRLLVRHRFAGEQHLLGARRADQARQAHRTVARQVRRGATRAGPAQRRAAGRAGRRRARAPVRRRAPARRWRRSSASACARGAAAPCPRTGSCARSRRRAGPRTP